MQYHEIAYGEPEGNIDFDSIYDRVLFVTNNLDIRRVDADVSLVSASDSGYEICVYIGDEPHITFDTLEEFEVWADAYIN